MTGAGHVGAGPSRQGADEQQYAGSVRDENPQLKAAMRRDCPDLATLEPAEDDEDVFGDACPLIVRWRELKVSRPNDGKGFEWLVERERLLETELALPEEYGLTLPPGKQPLRGLDRSGQVSWRRTALFDTRRARARREFVGQVVGLLTQRWLRPSR